MMTDSSDAGRGRREVLITGASGYIGGRLMAALESAPCRIRCLSRDPAFLESRVHASTRVFRGDVLDADSLRPALAGVDTAYYLIHSMGSSGDFKSLDRRAAENFGQMAEELGVRRIIYLGGLGSGTELSPHLESRQEVGRILRGSGVQTLEFRASIILGSGSPSFEIIRSLVDRLPVMVTPRWTRTLAQPIAVEDVIEYLAAGMDLEMDGSDVLEIGGADRVSYLDLMTEYARLRGLRRFILPVPFLTPRLSSLWLGLVTPVYARVGRKLIDGVRNETVVRGVQALRAFEIRPRTAKKAMERALLNEDQEFARTRWCDAYPPRGRNRHWGGIRFGKRIIDSRATRLRVPSQRAFSAVEAIGGKTGWYYADWLWRLRGFLDLLIGGVGLRRGRKHPRRLMTGDTVDFWRVESIDRNRCLRLYAEMRLPGRAWLQFEVEPDGEACILRQTAEFDPAGWLGALYWYALYPLHGLIFGGMLRNLARSAEDSGQRAT